MKLNYPLFISMIMGPIASTFAAPHQPTEIDEHIRIFGAEERQAMLVAYHAKMSKEQVFEVKDLKTWETKRELLKAQLLDGWGLNPMPRKMPLDPVYSPNKIDRGSYTIQRVYYQTFPGLYTTCLLYMPKDIKGKVPAVISPHGHWAGWSTDELVQARNAGLAQKGYVTLVVQYEHYQDLGTGLPARGVFLYNNMRGLDFLQSLPQVDPNRIGVTGASGGGMQTMDLAAVDDRIKAAAVAVMPSYAKEILYIHTNGCPCSYSPIGYLRYMDHHHILALIAPKPMAVFSVTQDWTKFSVERELAQIGKVFDLYSRKGPQITPEGKPGAYALMGSKNGLMLGERIVGPHSYYPEMRVRMYWWMDWWLKDKKTPVPDPEPKLQIESQKDIRNLRVPEGIVGDDWTNRNLSVVVRPWRQFTAPTLKTENDTVNYSRTFRATVEDLLNLPKVSYQGSPEVKMIGKANVDSWDIEKMTFKSEELVRVPGLLIRKKGAPPVKNQQVSLMVFVMPYQEAVQKELDADRAVFTLDQRLTGEWNYHMAAAGEVPWPAWIYNTQAWGRPELGMAATDIKAAYDTLKSRKDCTIQGLRLIGLGPVAGKAALVTAAVFPIFKDTIADMDHTDFAMDDPEHTSDSKGDLQARLPQFLRYGNVGELAALVAPRKLDLLRVNPHTHLDTAKAAYQLKNSTAKFNARILARGGLNEIPIPGGDFESDAGWMIEGIGPAKRSSEKADMGKTSLRLDNALTVKSPTFDLSPYTAYRLYLHVNKGQVLFETTLITNNGTKKIGSDLKTRKGFQELTFDFVASPGQTEGHLELSCQETRNHKGLVWVDNVRLVKVRQLSPLKADDTELITTSSYPKNQQPGPHKLEPRGKWIVGYGPEAEVNIIKTKRAAGKALQIKNTKDKGYVAVCASLNENQLIIGGLYRFSVTAKATGSVTLNFWHCPTHLSPRLRVEPVPGWQTYTLDIFIENKEQLHLLPTFSANKEIVVESISLKRIEP